MRLQSVTVMGIALLAIAFSASVVGAAQGTGLPPEMTGVEWTLVSLQDAQGSQQDTTGKGLTIQFEPDGSVFGSGGCNRFRGTFTAGDAQQLTIGPLASTLIGCDQPVADLETAYLQALEGVGGYRLDGAGRLELTFGDQGVLSYTGGGGQPASLPQTGGAGDSAPLLLLFAVLCCVAGLWLASWARGLSRAG